MAAILGIVEGLTEFLPISSTGHLILVSKLMGIDTLKGIESFEIGIQSGAILAVILLYRKKLLGLLLGCIKRDSKSIKTILTVGIAFLPAVVMGVLFGSEIKAVLFHPVYVVAALFVGGVAMVVLERKLVIKHGKNKIAEKADVENYRQALSIGLFQCLALWPGTSRSMATILGARLLGIQAKAAAEFSFLLAIPTLLGACAYDVLKHRHELMNSEMPLMGWIVGFVTAFFSAWLVIKWFINYLSKNSLESFGWYRILVAVAYCIANV